MRPFALMIRLLLASAVASAAAGLLALILLLLGMIFRLEGGMGAGDVLFALLFGLFVGGLAIIPAVALLTLPTMLVGGSLWHSVENRAVARRRSSLALAGALLGGVAYPILVAAGPSAMLPSPGALVRSEWLAFGIFIIAGACAGLVFRSTMFALGAFFGDEAEDASDAGQGAYVP